MRGAGGGGGTLRDEIGKVWRHQHEKGLLLCVLANLIRGNVGRVFYYINKAESVLKINWTNRKTL